jgi:hypothetical protein
MASSSAPRRGCASVAFASRAEVLARRVSSTTDSTPFSGRFLACDVVSRLSTRARESHPHSTFTPSVVVYRLDDRLFFANASYVKGRVPEALRAAPTATRWLLSAPRRRARRCCRPRRARRPGRRPALRGGRARRSADEGPGAPAPRRRRRDRAHWGGALLPDGAGRGGGLRARGRRLMAEAQPWGAVGASSPLVGGAIGPLLNTPTIVLGFVIRAAPRRARGASERIRPRAPAPTPQRHNGTPHVAIPTGGPDRRSGAPPHASSESASHPLAELPDDTRRPRVQKCLSRRPHSCTNGCVSGSLTTYAAVCSPGRPSSSRGGPGRGVTARCCRLAS